MVSKSLILTLLAVVALTYAQESPPPPTGDATEPPTEPPSTTFEPDDVEEPEFACEGIFDLGFILDSSSSIGRANFSEALFFIQRIVNDLNIGRDQTRVSLARYNSWVDSRFFFNTLFERDQVIASIANTPYYGKGTETAEAIGVFANHHVAAYNGWREGRVPTVVIVITDGMSQDADLLPQATRDLLEKSTRVIAIGIGSDVNGGELAQIATRPAAANVIVAEDFQSLDFEVDAILNRVCETANDVNECMEENGSCDQICINTFDGFYCDCNIGYTLAADVTTCVDTDECADNNGGCSDICVNTPGSYECQCADGRIIGADGQSCVDDSCFTGNDCDQVCVNIVEGTFRCACRAGYRLNEDGTSCSDINECLENNGGCESSCNNTMGGFNCGCPDGEGLREDGRTCGIQCYVCDRALTNEDCQTLVVCAETQRSCQTTTRRENGQTFISKQCKQTEACANNFIQNPRTAFSPTQCNGGAESTVSVCRCCCHASSCNAPADCTLADEIDIECPDPLTIFEIPPPMNISCSGNRIGDVCDLTCPTGFEPVNGDSVLVCSPVPRTLDGFWNGQVGECGDIDECLTDNGGCSHTCTNTIGSFECSCPDNNPCANQILDLFFILDSSSSVGQDNFNIMLNFVKEAVAPLTVGQDDVRVGLLTYNRRTTKRFDFNQVANNTDFDMKVDAIEYSGRGTRTARAIETATQDCFRADRGRRENVPLAVVVITDGRSQDWRRLPRAVEGLYALTDDVFAIGVSDRVNENELLQIANEDTSNYVMVENFEALDVDLLNIVSDRICTQPEPQHFLTSDLRNCDVDECAIGNGGCSHDCVNTVGSFMCVCPEGFSQVGVDGVCDENECLVNNGDCEQICINVPLSRQCACESAYQVNGTQCIDFDECLDENGGCSHGCENIEEGHRCTCPQGLILGDDLETCEVDSCFNQEFPFICSQRCVNIPGGSYMCQCDDGYSLDEDAHNCTEINECDMSNGGCEYSCVNTDGSFFCECPEGHSLREDGRTCGIVCYTCQNALSNEECNLPVACAVSQDACFTTLRTRDNVTRIFKGCQQTEACVNNLIQNLRESGEGPSQCNLNLQNSKCECCCMESFCNADVCPYNFTLPGCPSFQQEDVMFYGLQDNGEVFPGGSARVTCAEGFTFASGGLLRTQLNCDYSFQNQTAQWDGLPEDLDSCMDIDECAENDGGCVQPDATCVNFPGGYECVCPDEPDDYELIDDVICERDECADVDQGGCSHNCTNTIGSYQCTCPNGYSLLVDGLTCDFNECQDANGGCQQICVNILGGHICECAEGFTIGEDGTSCVDIDECLDNNGGCSDICTNLMPGYECSCPEDMLLNDDGFTCRINPCFVDNGGCGQICTPLEVGSMCSCLPGYELLNDGSCIDIDECIDNAAGCQYNCTNFDGGFTCECPMGEALRQDGRTCGRACYSCQNAATNEECNAQPLEVCPSDAGACENQVRIHDGITRIFKRCKQEQSCNNNFIQNPRTAFLPTQCNGNDANDVCRCCCTGHLCNFNEKPCAAEVTCNANIADVVVVLDSSSSVKFDNFQIMKSFTASLFRTFRLGQDQVHAALLRYNNRQDEIFGLANTNDLDEVIDAVEGVPYNGRGTLTGAALTYVRENILRVENGARPDVPQIVITVTDGLAQDNVGRPSEALRAEGVTTFAVGIGSAISNNRQQLADIAGDPSRMFVVENFEDLSGSILTSVQEAICHDENECDVNNGDCSHECVNTQGSFQCRCPEDYGLDADLRTCIPGLNESLSAVNECAVDNGGCSQVCQDFLDGFNCSCDAGFELGLDLRTCFDVDECDDTPCSHYCVNTLGSFFCECPADYMITSDRTTCVARAGPADCGAGYDAVGHSCTRILNDVTRNFEMAQAECETNGGRLVKIADDGNVLVFGRRYPAASWIGLTGSADTGFTYLDGTPMMLPNAWAPGQPEGQGCVYLDGRFFVASCEDEFYGICEIPRANGFVTFSRIWQNGAQGTLYFPTDVNEVLVTFPSRILNLNVWYGTVTSRMNSRQFVISQNDIERQSGMGEAQFVIDMTNRRFPSYEVVVEPYTP